MLIKLGMCKQPGKKQVLMSTGSFVLVFFKWAHHYNTAFSFLWESTASNLPLPLEGKKQKI